MSIYEYGITDNVNTTFVRPADTTAYAALDAVTNSTSAPTILTFSSVARKAGGSGYITTARLQKSTVTTTNATFRLYLFNTAITSVNDNAAYTLLWANRASLVGQINFTLATAGSGSDTAAATETNINLAFECAAADTNLYGILMATAAYTPASQENFRVDLFIERN